MIRPHPGDDDNVAAAPTTDHDTEPWTNRHANVDRDLHKPTPVADLTLRSTIPGEQKVTEVPIVNGCIDVTFANLAYPALVDTGANVSCIVEGILPTIEKVTKIQYVRVKMRISLADGTFRHIRKAAIVSFKINKVKFSQTFAIFQHSDFPIILGTDFLFKCKSNIQFDHDPTPDHQPIRATKNITIPPYSELALTGSVNCLNSVHQTQGITDIS